jgi:hypothetical protein
VEQAAGCQINPSHGAGMIEPTIAAQTLHLSTRTVAEVLREASLAIWKRHYGTAIARLDEADMLLANLQDGCRDLLARIDAIKAIYEGMK